MHSKKQLSEADICAKFITPAITAAGWDEHTQLRREISFTDGRIYVKGKMTSRGQKKRADYILYLRPNLPIAIVEAKENTLAVGAGLPQALDYARTLDIPFVFSSNGDGFVFYDKTATENEPLERELSLEEFPSPDWLWKRYKRFKGITEEQEHIVLEDYYLDRSGRKPRYYQLIAINRTVEAVAQGQNRVLLVMATGTGKTYTAFNIIYRLWKSGLKKRILFLADRTALIDQTRRGDFRHFGEKMTIIKKKVIEVERTDGSREEKLVSTNKRGIDAADKAYEIYLGLYQGLTSAEDADAYKDFSPDFFDLIVIDECHRGSAKEDSAWREILNYFSAATHIGLTATPKETKYVSNIEYFGDPIYTYSLRQGIEDGFLAPYKVIRIGFNVDLEGWRPEYGKRDKHGQLVEDRIYNRKDYDESLVIEERTKLAAQKVTEFLNGNGRYQKTIVFCRDIDHAERMRRELAELNRDMMAKSDRYVVRITGDTDNPWRYELDNFINPEERYPVIATTSKLLTTGIDAKTCKLIVLDSPIQSLTEFKQIIGRGTRIDEDFDKLYFTIMDFRNATDLFADPDFDGDPVLIKEGGEDMDVGSIEEQEEQSEEPIVDELSGEEVEFEYPVLPDAGDIVEEPRQKIIVNGVDVSVLAERKIHFDHEGRPITTSLQVHTKNQLTERFGTLEEFLKQWNASERKTILIEELKRQGVLVDELHNAVNREVDLFDLICHVAFDRPPLNRKDRAENVKKRNYFTKYGDQARKVLESLLDKYADEGLEDLESIGILKLQPFIQYGSTVEIVNGVFGGKEEYLKAVRELEQEIYKTTA